MDSFDACPPLVFIVRYRTQWSEEMENIAAEGITRALGLADAFLVLAGG
jgi:hypothetical protein